MEPKHVDTEGTVGARPEVAFYTVANSTHFVGVVGLLNSLRLVGHDEPLFILDCGLTGRERAQLAEHAQLVTAPREAAPTAIKNILPLQHGADVMVLLDADVIVTQRLDNPIERALGGTIVAFADDTPSRFFVEWDELGLGPPRRQTYVSAGHLVVPAALAHEVLGQVDPLAASIDVARTFVAGGDPGDPLYYLDQDVLNAVLACSVPVERLEILDAGHAAYTPFRGLELLDEITLECRYEDGSAPLLLHHVLAKPWLSPLHPNVYSRLLIRLLCGPGLALTPDRNQVPVRLRTGRLGRLDRARAASQASIHKRVRGRLGVRRRLAARRRRHRLLEQHLEPVAPPLDPPPHDRPSGQSDSPVSG